jgi:glycosyltransferase involved in cell wall biosynthesis
VRELWILDHADIEGGGQRFALRLARFVAANRPYRVRVVCPRSSGLAGWCEEAGVEVLDARFPEPVPRRAPSIVRGVARTRALLRMAPADVILVGNSARVQAYLYGASRFLRRALRVVHLMHEQDSTRRPSARFVFRRFGQLVVMGENAARSYRRVLPGVPVSAINNFLEDGELRRFAAVRRDGGPPGPPVLGVLGRLIPEKGIIELVEELGDERVLPSWARLVVAAFPQDAAYEEGLRRRIVELGLEERVELAGPRSDVDRFLAEIDVLVVPSVGNEAQPTVIVEALAAGVPVLLREPLWSEAFDGLPVGAYRAGDDLPAALRSLPPEPAALEEVARRFGPDQALEGIENAARSGAVP